MMRWESGHDKRIPMDQAIFWVNLFDLFIVPFSQMLESPQNPGQFTSSSTGRIRDSGTSRDGKDAPERGPGDQGD